MFTDPPPSPHRAVAAATLSSPFTPFTYDHVRPADGEDPFDIDDVDLHEGEELDNWPPEFETCTTLPEPGTYIANGFYHCSVNEVHVPDHGEFTLKADGSGFVDAGNGRDTGYAIEGDTLMAVNNGAVTVTIQVC